MSEKILNLLVPSAVCTGFEAQTAQEVITCLGELLYQAGFVHQTFAQAALDREAKMPTGLPLEGKYNAAIPHTDIEHVIKPALAIAALKQPVVFQNMIEPEQAVPVQLVILMALEQAKTQVEMLQEIAGVLQDPTVIEKLVNANNYEQVRLAFS